MPLTPVPQIRLFQDWIAAHRGLTFETYNDLWHWSVTDLDAFWQCIWDFEKMQSRTPYEAVLSDERMPGAVWFKGAEVNYARQVFAQGAAAHAAGQPAIVAEDETGKATILTWPEMRRQAASLALALRDLGVRPGDRVAAYLPIFPRPLLPSWPAPAWVQHGACARQTWVRKL